MSDHWNSIANLLKTPSLGPTAKKTDGPAKPLKATSLVDQTVPVEESASPVPEPAKSKAEPSRLRSSWDAVATFFGVATPENSQEDQPKSNVSSDSKLDALATPKSVTSGNRKSKPSMWGETVEKRIIESEAPNPPTRLAENNELPLDGESRDRGRSRGRERSPRVDDAAVRSDQETRRVPQTQRDQEPGTVDPDRRSHRQQPRRGRQADVRADAPFAESAMDSGLNDENSKLDSENLDRNDSPRSEPSRTPRGRGQRSPSENGDVRPERTNSSERHTRPERAGREDRPDRPPRSDSADRPDRADRPQRPARQDDSDRPARPHRAEGSVRPDHSRAESSERPSRTDRGDRPSRVDRAERPPRAEGAGRAERPSHAEGAGRAERPSHAEGAERNERPPRTDRSEQSDRPARADRPARSESADRPARDRPARSDRTSSPREEHGVRDGNAPRRPRPSSPTISKNPSGFGEGIHDDDTFEFIDDTSKIHDDYESLDDRVETDSDDSGSRDLAERESRPRRRRGRGQRSEARGNENVDIPSDPRDVDEDRDIDDDSGELIGRNSRIPSWQDAIGTLVATNMENHQRNQSQSRGPRGRGPRRDR